MFYGWKGSGLRYILLLSALLALLPSFAIHNKVNYVLSGDSSGGKSIAKIIIEQMPDLKYSKGKLYTPEPRPYRINHPESNETLVLIDTTGKTHNILTTDAVALLTATDFQLHHGGAVERIALANVLSALDLDPMGEYAVNQSAILDWIEERKFFFPVQLFLTFFLNLFINSILYSFVLALFMLGIIFMKGGRTALRNCFRTTLIAGTPVALLKTIELSLGLMIFSYPALIHTAIHAAYCVVALEAVLSVKKVVIRRKPDSL